jgi:hypothetical protein
MKTDEIREINRLAKQLDNLDYPEVGIIVDSTNVSNPPTDAELDAIFGTPATRYPGFIAVVDDAGAGLNVYLVVTNGSNWFYQLLTVAI